MSLQSPLSRQDNFKNIKTSQSQAENISDFGVKRGSTTHKENERNLDSMRTFNKQSISQKSKLLADKIMSSLKFKRLDIPQYTLNTLYNLQTNSQKKNESKAIFSNSQSLRDLQKGKQLTLKKQVSIADIARNLHTQRSTPQLIDEASNPRIQSSPNLNQENLVQLFQIFSDLLSQQSTAHTRSVKQSVHQITSPQYSSIPKAQRQKFIKDPIGVGLSRDKLQRNIAGVHSLSALTRAQKFQMEKQKSPIKYAQKRIQCSSPIKQTQSSVMKQNVKKVQNIITIFEKPKKQDQRTYSKIKVNDVVRRLPDLMASHIDSSYRSPPNELNESDGDVNYQGMKFYQSEW